MSKALLVQNQRWLIASFTFTVVALTALGLGLGLGLGNRINDLNTQLTQTQNTGLVARLALEETVMELAMNVTETAPVETIVQTGTYTIIFDEGARDLVTTMVPYTLKETTIGQLTFPTLVLDPPPVAFVTSASITLLEVFMYDFSPALPAIPGSVFPISNKNLKRFTLPCVASDACTLYPDATTDYPSAFRIYRPFGFQLDGQFRTSGVADQNVDFTFSEPLELHLLV